MKKESEVERGPCKGGRKGGISVAIMLYDLNKETQVPIWKVDSMHMCEWTWLF